MPATMSTTQSPRNKKAATGPPTSAMPPPQQKRSSLRYSLNHLGKALADAVGKEPKGTTTHLRSVSAIPTVADRSITPAGNSPSPRPAHARRPSVAGAFEESSSAPTSRAPSQAQAYIRTRTLSTTRGLTQHKATTGSPRRGSPAKLSPTPTPAPAAPTGVLPLPRRRSLMVKGALAAPSAGTSPAPVAANPVPVGTTKVSIRPKTATPVPTRSSPTQEERPMEVKERRTDSPRAVHAAVTRLEPRPSPVRAGSGLPTPRGRASPTRNEQTPTPKPAKDDREKRRERREKEKLAAEEAEREKQEAQRAKKVAKKAEEAASGHRTSGSTTTLASSIFTSASRSSTGDSHSSGGSTSKLQPKSNTTVFPRAAQTVVLTPPDEEEDTTIQTPMTRSRTATGSTTFGDISTPAISKTLLASISAQNESPLMAPLDQRLRRSNSVASLSSGLPSPLHPGTVKFPPPAAGLPASSTPAKGHRQDGEDEEWEEEGDVSALLETVISPLKGQATPAMPRFNKSSKPSRSRMPETPSRGPAPSREALAYASPAIPALMQRTAQVDRANQAANRPRESILSWDAIVERSRLEEGDFEDMLRAPPPAVGLISPDMRPARNLPRLTTIGPKRVLAGISDSEPEVEEETVHGQTISQVLFQQSQTPASPEREKRLSKGRRELAEKEKLWAAKEAAWEKQRAEWETEREQWQAERAQWGMQQTQWNAQRAQWNAQQSEWDRLQSQRTEWEKQRVEWNAREHELTVAVQARDDDLEALEQESRARTADLERRVQEHEREVEALMKQAETFQVQSHELAVAREKVRTSAWTGVCKGLKADADACAADRAALRVILLGLEAMVRV